MIKNILFAITLTATINSIAGDTTNIRVHDHTDMTWYGNYNEWGVFPDGSETYRKIYLNYTMGCASSGCSDWDYTTKIEVLHRTGEIDSTLHTQARFTVNSTILDSVSFSPDSTYFHFWDTSTNSLDSALSTYLEIIKYDDVNNPTTPTDTIYAFQSGFYNMIFNSVGNIIDSNYIVPNVTAYIAYFTWYTYFDVIEKYELARVITPYGSGLNNNWEFTHIFDVTDLASILQDSVEIRAHYSGWSSGFSATLDFEFIQGTPPRNVTSLQNIYAGGCSYTTSSAFEQSCLPPKMFWIDANSTQAMVKMTTTGHGFDNNQSAAEFKPIDYSLHVDGSLTHTQFNWDSDCGINPISPQGGTWIYDRANWCPGKRAQTFDHEISNYITSSDSVEINVDFQSYSWSGTQTPSYIIDCQLFLYEGANFTNDVEITDIIKPSLKDEYSRFNPVCGKPLIKIRNYGSDPLTSVVIEYGVVGGVVHTYTWNGFLAFLEEEEVELPLLQNWGGIKDVFQVSLSNPSGQSDEYADNNIMKTPFEHVPQYQEKFAVWTQTNDGVISTWTNESETSWKFLKDDGTLHDISQTMYANNQYRDTIEFESGCYTFIVEDSDEDGLDYWANSDGIGYVKLRNVPGSWFSNFDSDFGTNIIHNFRVGTILSSEKILDNLQIFPNPATDNIRLESASLINTEIKVLNLLGEEIYSKTANSNSEEISISSFPNGIYTIEVQGNNIVMTQKFVKQ
jgi:hypothetical protein